MEKNRFLTNSVKEFEKAQSLIPEGIKGMHKIIRDKEYPTYFVKGGGAYVWDIDNNQYIEFVMGKGPYILGYCRPEVDRAVVEQVALGNLFPMGNPLQNKLAEKVIQLIPSVERVIYYKTGSCATAAAVRIARGYTGKNMVLSSGYHGWQDWCSSGVGVPDPNHFYDFEYSIDKLQNYIQASDDIAAVIITPEELYFTQEYYLTIQNLCQENGIIFILDEVKSGFRVALGGFQAKYNLNPDLSIFSKAVSNGYPLAILGGKKEIIEFHTNLHTAGTYDIEVIPIAAALATIAILESENTIEYIYRNGEYFQYELNRIFKENQIGIHTVFAGGSLRFWSESLQLEERFYSFMASKGVLFYAYDNSFISSAHTREVLDKVLDITRDVVENHLADYKGTYFDFELNTIKRLNNKKGFLKGYPGEGGRGE